MKKAMVHPWLELLLATQFFTTCRNHLLSNRNDCNLFCIDCEAPPAAFCYYCRSHHHLTHRVIQIRRSSYHDVVRVSEVEDILDISDVQTYVINGSSVVFLNERPQLRGCVSSCKALSSSSYSCETCGRALLDQFRFCSLGCNVKGIKQDMEMPAKAENGSECGGNEDVTSGNIVGSTSENNTGPSTMTEKKKFNENNEEVPPAKRVARHRRKGIPQRAPFF
ncbi:protein RGF1 INDUCIBLE TRANSCRIPTION FACTOR 1-like [Phragmites australis]|uniref:protein RGF1 INDUCIBLE TRANSCRIPTION FACTOR 1-like n=1 Tax=Phragmites australis TaxID=29695 RepID=UPI002D78E1AB|nr:protein RGF1 INDUCIBLE TRANSCRIPTION FACTOR 1-like [Phragmites australis]